MRILGRFAFGEIVGSSNSPFPSVRMARLFYEFFNRYKEWKFAKHQETILMTVAWCLVLFSLLVPLFLPKIWNFMAFVVPVLFYLVMHYYLKLNKRITHLEVNVQILHYHLLGKLEVGFCDHTGPCQCSEKFCNYVHRYFNIFLDKNFIK